MGCHSSWPGDFHLNVAFVRGGFKDLLKLAVLNRPIFPIRVSYFQRVEFGIAFLKAYRWAIQ